VILHQSRLSAGAFAAGWVHAVGIQRQHRRCRNQHRTKGDLSIGKSYIVTPVYESHELSPLHARACAPRSDLPRKAGMPLFSELGCGGGRDAAGRSSFPCKTSWNSTACCYCYIHVLLQIAGMVIAPVAFIFILYALFMYKKRTIQVT